MFTANLHPHPQYPRFSRPIAAIAAVVALAIAVVVAVGLGHSIGSGSAGAKAQAQPMGPDLPLSERVLAPSAFGGFVRTALSARVPVTPRLRRLGFVAGVNEQLHGIYPMKAQAVSVVERFRSVSGARAELAYGDKTFAFGHGQKLERYPVIGIPGAIGWSVRDGRTTGMNVMFTNGSFYYLVGAAVSGHESGVPTRANLVAAAQAIYLMVNGCVTPGAHAHLA